MSNIMIRFSKALPCEKLFIPLIKLWKESFQ